MFDAHPPAFGSIQVRERLADGRHGPVFLGHDADTAQPVVIRTFEVDLDPESRARLLEALQQVCDLPLQHAAVGRPIACGMAGDRLCVAHTYLPGLPVDEWLRVGEGPCRLVDLLVPLASVAAAIDFAAAAGVHHGALGAGDVIIDGDSAGVTGWGIEQARAAAGLMATTPSHADDIAAFASIAATMTTDADLVRDVFEHGRPASALALVAALQEQVAVAEPDVVEHAFDAPLRVEAIDEPVLEPVFDDVGRMSPEDGPAEVPMFAASAGSASQNPAYAHHRRRGRPWLAAAAVAALLVVAAFAGGVFIGRQQSVTIAPIPAAPVVAATSGRTFTDAPVIAPEVPAPPVAPATGQAIETPPATDRVVEDARGERVPAALQIDSRPQGAQVYVDGHLVGRTPLVTGGLRPGQHLVRMQMPGRRQWTTAVTVAAGEHARVGGSLEEY